MSINLELLDLRAFLSVFDSGSFREAAHVLAVSQPALSRRIQGFESRLDLALFERSTRRVEPTAAGRHLAPSVRRLLDEFEASLASMNDMNARRREQITVASIPTAATYFLPSAIQKFNKRYPSIRLRVVECLPREGLECVLRGEADFGINVIGATEVDVNYTHLLDDPYVLVCRRDHPLAKKRNVDWSDLEDHTLIRIGEAPNNVSLLGRSGDSLNRAVLDNALGKMNIRLHWLYEAYNLTTVLSLVEIGLGASVVPRLATPRYAHRALVTKMLRPSALTRSIGLVERRNATLSEATSFFREIIVSECQATDDHRSGMRSRVR